MFTTKNKEVYAKGIKVLLDVLDSLTTKDTKLFTKELCLPLSTLRFSLRELRFCWMKWILYH